VHRARQQENGGEGGKTADCACGHGDASCDQWWQAMMIAPAKLRNRA
jgi:hypothetical protein